MYDEIDAITQKDAWNLDDLKVLAYTDLSEMDPHERIHLDRWVTWFLKEYGEPWDDRNPRYPNDTFLYGYKFEGELFVTGYSGVAGAYWNRPDFWTICKPY